MMLDTHLARDVFAAADGLERAPLLSALGLTKRYGESFLATHDVSLALAAGEFAAIVGHSGSGKSTLLAMLGTLTRPTEGQVRLDGADVWALSEHARSDLRRRRIGFVFQFPSLLANLRAVDNVALPAMLGHDTPPAAIYARARALLQRVGLASRLHAYPGEMSGGEQRRVAIARALINTPSVILADEPTGDLDEETEAEMMDLLQNLRRELGFGMLMVTHNLDLAACADRSLRMEHGVLAPVGLGAGRVVRRPARPPAEAGMSAAPTVPVAEATLAAGVADAAGLGGGLRRAAPRVLVVAAVLFGLVLAGNEGVARWQQYQAQLRINRLSDLETLAIDTLHSETDSVTSLGDNRYEIGIYLENTAGERKPIYVMSPTVRAFVQVGLDWVEMKLTPVEDATATVRKVTTKQIYRYILETGGIKKFTQIMPYYMHVRFENDMFVSPQIAPTEDIFHRNESYYIYLRPDGVDDATILKRVKFPGAPPLWVWMPPH